MRQRNLPLQFQHQGLQSITPAVLRESDKRAALGQDTAEARLRKMQNLLKIFRFDGEQTCVPNTLLVMRHRKTLSHTHHSPRVSCSMLQSFTTLVQYPPMLHIDLSGINISCNEVPCSTM